MKDPAILVLANGSLHPYTYTVKVGCSESVGFVARR